MENEFSTGDSEVDALIYGEEGIQPTPAGANPKSGEAKTWEAGGRKWDSPDKLAKSYDALVRDYSKTKNELKGAKPWLDFGKYLESNPQLRDDLKKRVDEYHTNRQAGQSPAAAGKDAGLPKEYIDRIERVEAAHADLLLDREISNLQRKYKVDDETLQAVLKFSGENDGIALETALKAVSYDKQIAQAKEDGMKGAQALRVKKAAANVGPSSHPSVAPGNKPNNKLTPDEQKEKLSKRLEEFGITG